MIEKKKEMPRANEGNEGKGGRGKGQEGMRGKIRREK